MDTPDALRRRFSRVHLFWCAIACMFFALVLLIGYAKSWAAERRVIEEIGLSLPLIKSKVTLLEASIEAERVIGLQSAASHEEQAAVYILPETIETARVVRLFNALAPATGADSTSLAVDAISFAVRPQQARLGRELTSHLRLTGSPEALGQLVSILELGGLITVRDVLAKNVVDAVLTNVEQLSPFSLRTAEEFLSIDLLKYAADADDLEDRFGRDMPPALALDLKTQMLKSGLSDVRQLLSPLAAKLREQRMWPLPLSQVKSVHCVERKCEVEVGLFVR